MEGYIRCLFHSRGVILEDPCFDTSPTQAHILQCSEPSHAFPRFGKPPDETFAKRSSPNGIPTNYHPAKGVNFEICSFKPDPGRGKLIAKAETSTGFTINLHGHDCREIAASLSASEIDMGLQDKVMKRRG